MKPIVDGTCFGVDPDKACTISQCMVALSLMYDDNVNMWSNAIPMDLSPNSFFKPIDNDVLIVPCYSNLTNTNTCFLPVICSHEMVNGTHYTVFSTMAEIENNTKFTLHVKSSSYQYQIASHDKKPFYSEVVLMKEDVYSFQICMDGIEWSEPIRIQEGSSTILLTHYVFYSSSYEIALPVRSNHQSSSESKCNGS